MKEYLHFRTDVGPPRVNLDTKSNDRQNARNSEKVLTDVEGDVGGGESNGDLHKGIVEYPR